MDARTLALALRSLGRLLARGLPARLLVLPMLMRNERSAAALNAYVARRARRLGVAVPPDATRLHAVPPGAFLLAKSALRQDPARHLRPRRFGSLLRNTIRTSGTSGSPLTLVQSLGAVIREEAFIQRQLRWIGWRPGQRRAWIRGDLVCDERPDDGRYWRRDPVGKLLVMSSYHLSNATIGAYVTALEAFDPVVIHAYPSSIGAIAHWLEAAGRRYRGRALRGVMTSSETLEPGVRAAVMRAFGVIVFDWYGQAERVAAIGTCEHGRYHLLTDYGGVELLGLPDGSSELVGTSLNNAAMPLARYRTGDTVHVGDPAPCPCGRVFPTLEAVIGRQERIVTLPDGRIVARLDRVFQGSGLRLLEGQVRYHGQARFTLRVVAADGFGSRDEAALREQFLQRVPDVQVAVERVEAIPRGANGKFEFIAVDG
ncbi:phenylacetate--CoA ligase family protein [Massilia arenae]|uniref:Phenylacetate--CoA ligase family protein n=1 Tax=Massilia arenae TaxID=2603288 RepID=A0A5C7G415_9BURK|nr:phenylacetate--CoA ligase family protein [Massilia arenae]TXG00082.1 phenylacetate--CoA ligase family protein [Massilia arenae]